MEPVLRNNPAQPRENPLRSFRCLLQDELISRCRDNPRYSLRAFARSLGVEPSALSQMIHGKRPITGKMKLRLGAALGIKIEELAHIPASDAEASQLAPAVEFQRLDPDTFALMADWYHYAILELTYVEGFRPDPAWVARRLGISRSEVKIALERLQRLGLLGVTRGGLWIDRSDGGRLTHLRPGLSSDAARAHQVQLLELSKRAVQEIPLELRNHTSAAFCFEPADLPAAVEAIAAFRRKFAEDFQPRKGGKEVYQLQISFFPLSQRKEPV